MARAVAVIGMFGAHVGVRADAVVWRDPSTWSALVDGRPSLLFALLAGVSLALLTTSTTRSEGPRDVDALRTLRLRLVGRGATVFAVGVVLELFSTGIAVVLTLYGVLFVAVIPVLGWSRRRLLALALGLVLLGPPLLALALVLSRAASGPGSALVLFGSYPVTVWFALVLVGLAVGRTSLRSTTTAVALLVGGVLLAVTGYGLGSLAQEQVARAQAEDTGVFYDPATHDGYRDYLRDQDVGPRMYVAVLQVEPHSGGVLEVVGSGGFGLAVLGACLLLCRARPLRWALVPLAATGSMPLSVYSAQVVAIAVVTPAGLTQQDNTLWWQLTLWSVVGATAWAGLVGRGPLERLTARVADAAAVGDGRASAPRTS